MIPDGLWACAGDLGCEEIVGTPGYDYTVTF